MALGLQPVGTTNSLPLQVFETLKGAIFEGDFQPGDFLREAHLAQELRVSQATVREALAQLERLGLVKRIPNKGTSVTKLSKKEIQDRLSVRLTLEELAFVSAAERMTKSDFRQLEKRLSKLSATILKNEYFETAYEDLEFHRFVWKKSDNHVLYETLDQLVMPLFAFISILRKGGKEELKDTVNSHEQLINALKGRNADEIRRVLREHFVNYEDKV